MASEAYTLQFGYLEFRVLGFWASEAPSGPYWFVNPEGPKFLSQAELKPLGAAWPSNG